MAGAKQVTVTVREGAVVYHDGHAYAAGQQIKATAAEAKALREQGVVER
jgi:hypothetical protein